MSLDELEQQVLRMIRVERLIQPGQRILTGVSAGRDSVCLLSILARLAPEIGFHLQAAHFNHGLRGRESGQDARFIRSFCRGLNVECFGGKWLHPRGGPRPPAISEQSARAARFEFLLRTLDRQRCDALALAHHRGDAAETILINLLRGSGMRGLRGIEPVSRIAGCTVIRPLLRVPREAIDRYLQARKLRWREDSSNRDRTYLRNRVRHELLPLLERKYNPDVRGALIRMAEILSAEDRHLEEISGRRLRAVAGTAAGAIPDELPLAAFRRQPLALQRRMLRAWLTALRPDSTPPPFGSVEDLLVLFNAGKKGALLHSGDSLIFENTGAAIRLISREKGRRVRRKK